MRSRPKLAHAFSLLPLFLPIALTASVPVGWSVVATSDTDTSSPTLVAVATDDGASIGTAEPASFPESVVSGDDAAASTGLSHVASLPSIVAVHVRRHEPSGMEMLRARVELSPRGLRVRDDGGGRALEIVQDFIHERAWFVDRGRGIAHRLVRDLITGTGTDVSKADHDGAVVREGGFLGPVACAGGASREHGEGRWRGRGVDVRLCLDQRGETLAIELVDLGHGIVVYRRTPDGLIDELRDIRPMRFGEAHFSAPSRFRAVDERELFHGAPAIGEFDEGGDESP